MKCCFQVPRFFINTPDTRIRPVFLISGEIAGCSCSFISCSRRFENNRLKKRRNPKASSKHFQIKKQFHSRHPARNISKKKIYSNFDKYDNILIERTPPKKGVFIMLKKILTDKFTHSLSQKQWKQCALLLFVLLCILFLSCYYILIRSRNAQKNLISDYTAHYSSAMDQRILDMEEALSEDLTMVKDFLISETDFSDASQGTLAVLNKGRVLAAKGHNFLSYSLVAAAAADSKAALTVYAYSEPSLPGFYFCINPSQVSDLIYCYYEPALTGWPLLQKGLTAGTGCYLAVLLSAAMILFSLLIAAAPSRPAQERIVEITTPDETEAEAVFGDLPYFSSIIIDYHNTGSTPVSPEILKLFDQIISDNLSVNKILYQFSVQRSNSDCLQYDMNYANYNLRVLSDSLKMNLFNAAPDYEINIFYSNAVPTYQEMEKEVLYLHRNLRYSLILGYDKRLSIEQIRSFEASTEILDANAASTIQNHLRTRAYENLYVYLRHYRDILSRYQRSSGPHYSFAQVYRFAEEAFSVVKLFFQENSFEHPITETTCITILRANPGFHTFCEYLISCIQTYQRENQHVLTSRNEEIMNSIYQYIEEDLAGANLNSIARKMQITDSHLSRVFKKNTGSNFSEYLSERKLEEAAKLLVQEQKLKVAEISDMLGYGNPTYFLSRFKAKYGVSPSAYRKEHLEEQQ